MEDFTVSRAKQAEQRIKDEKLNLWEFYADRIKGQTLTEVLDITEFSVDEETATVEYMLKHSSERQKMMDGFNWFELTLGFVALDEYFPSNPNNPVKRSAEQIKKDYEELTGLNYEKSLMKLDGEDALNMKYIYANIKQPAIIKTLSVFGEKVLRLCFPIVFKKNMKDSWSKILLGGNKDFLKMLFTCTFTDDDQTMYEDDGEIKSVHKWAMCEAFSSIFGIKVIDVTYKETADWELIRLIFEDFGKD